MSYIISEDYLRFVSYISRSSYLEPSQISTPREEWYCLPLPMIGGREKGYILIIIRQSLQIRSEADDLSILLFTLIIITILYYYCRESLALYWERDSSWVCYQLGRGVGIIRSIAVIVEGSSNNKNNKSNQLEYPLNLLFC